MSLFAITAEPAAGKQTAPETPVAESEGSENAFSDMCAALCALLLPQQDNAGDEKPVGEEAANENGDGSQADDQCFARQLILPALMPSLADDEPAEQCPEEAATADTPVECETESAGETSTPATPEMPVLHLMPTTQKHESGAVPVQGSEVEAAPGETVEPGAGSIGAAEVDHVAAAATGSAVNNSKMPGEGAAEEGDVAVESARQHVEVDKAEREVSPVADDQEVELPDVLAMKPPSGESPASPVVEEQLPEETTPRSPGREPQGAFASGMRQESNRQGGAGLNRFSLDAVQRVAPAGPSVRHSNDHENEDQELPSNQSGQRHFVAAAPHPVRESTAEVEPPVVQSPAPTRGVGAAVSAAPRPDESSLPGADPAQVLREAAEARIAESLQPREVSIGEPLNRTERFSNLVEQIDKMVLTVAESRGKSMVITIVPENMGKVVVNCREKGDQLMVEIQAEHGNVREVLRQQEGPIRSLLEQSGYRLGQFDVRAEDDGGRGRGEWHHVWQEAEERQFEGRNGRGSKPAITGKVELPGEVPAQSGGFWVVV